MQADNTPTRLATAGDSSSPGRLGTAADPASPGRACPLHYRYRPEDIAAAPLREAEILYVVGGLYGNGPALAAVEAMAAAEAAHVTMVFNGDFNWFNVDDASFRAINERVLRHHATLGNVEAELFGDDGSAGCGCAYPEDVDDALVTRSNAIHARLRQTADRHPDLVARLAQLPMYARYRVGGIHVAVVHGDCESLAGWRFAVDTSATSDEVAAAFRRSACELIASSHTCLPVMRRIDGASLLANNGAAGMPNFRDQHSGLLTRIAAIRSPHPPRYGASLAGIHVDALPIVYDHATWTTDFLANWPPGSPAHQSYWPRIEQGPDFGIDQARP